MNGVKTRFANFTKGSETHVMGACVCGGGNAAGGTSVVTWGVAQVSTCSGTVGVGCVLAGVPTSSCVSSSSVGSRVGS